MVRCFTTPATVLKPRATFHSANSPIPSGSAYGIRHRSDPSAWMWEITCSRVPRTRNIMSILRSGMRSKMSRKVILSLMFAVMACANFTAMVRGEIVDKIVALVDGRIITLSDVRKQHQIDLALRYPVETDEEALNSLIDRY